MKCWWEKKVMYACATLTVKESLHCYSKDVNSELIYPVCVTDPPQSAYVTGTEQIIDGGWSL